MVPVVVLRRGHFAPNPRQEVGRQLLDDNEGDEDAPQLRLQLEEAVGVPSVLVEEALRLAHIA